MTIPAWAAHGAPVDRPNAARMYDYLLGGYHNFAVDRAVADQLIAINPDAPRVMQGYRAFLRRAVKFLVEQGIDQFLDLGSVTPTVGSTHEVAESLNPAARVVYVDIEPDTVRHSVALLQGNANTAAIQADLGRVEELLVHPEVRRLLDFNRPVGVLLALMHHLTDDQEAAHLVHVLRDAVPPGSYIALLHGTNEHTTAEFTEQLEALYAKSTTPVKLRSRAHILTFFDGLTLVEPGLVYIPLWRPEDSDDLFLDDAPRSATFGGVAFKG